MADVSMGSVTYGDVIAGLARPEELVPFGGEQAHKAFALALGLQLAVVVVRSRLRRAGASPQQHGAALRARAAGRRLPGDS